MATCKEVKKSKRGGAVKCTFPGGCNHPILPGELYYTWEFAYGSTFKQHKTHGYPKRSQLTQSKMGGAYDAIDNTSENINGFTDIDTIVEALNECADSLEAVRDEYQEGIDNMPENLQASATDAEEKIGKLEEAVTDIRSAADDIESEHGDLGDEPEVEDGHDSPDHDEWQAKMGVAVEEAKQTAQDALSGVDL